MRITSTTFFSYFLDDFKPEFDKHYKRMGKGKDPKVVSIHQARIIEFFDYLIEHNAKISVEIPTDIKGETTRRTYTKDHPRFNFRELVGEAMGLDLEDDKNKIDDFFRDSYVIRQSHQNSIRLKPKKKDVIHKVHFIFKNDSPSNPIFVKGLTTKTELFILKNYSIYRPINVREVYPFFYRNIRLRTLGIVENLLNKDGDCEKQHHFRESYLYEVQGAAPYINNIYMKALRAFDVEDLKTLKNAYSKISYDNVFTEGARVMPHILPDYPDLEVPFNICSEPDIGRNILERQQKLIDPFLPIPNNFDNPQEWFQGTRYQTIKLREQELLNTPVKEWPRFFAEHLLLTGAEFTAIKNEIADTCMDEVLENIEFRLFIGDQKTVNLHKPTLDLDEIAEILDEYIIHEGITELVNVEDASILSRPLQRYPNMQAVEQQPNLKTNIKKIVSFKLTFYLFDEIAKHLGFHSRDNNDYLRGDIDDFYSNLISG